MVLGRYLKRYTDSVVGANQKQAHLDTDFVTIDAGFAPMATPSVAAVLRYSYWPF